MFVCYTEYRENGFMDKIDYRFSYIIIKPTVNSFVDKINFRFSYKDGIQ